MKRFTLMLALTAALALPAAAQRAEGDKLPPLLTVTGTSEARATPDEATVRLGVTRQASSAQAAQEEVNTTAQAILTAVTRLGIKAEQIRTSQLTLFPVYAQQKPGSNEEPRIVAYRASNVVSIRLEKLTLAGPVIDAGLKAGANQLEGIQFQLRNDRPAREEALREAVAEARSKAKVIADALGVKLVAVYDVQESGVGVQPLPIFRGEAAMFARDAAATPVSPGQITVTATVTVRYRIQD